MKKIIFDGSCYDYLMRVNGFSCGLNTPPSLRGKGTHSLPPYCKRMPYLVDKYPSCPSNWMRSEGKIKSYFVPVKEGSGMWMDFNDNMTKINNVAVVISIQGINPITGLPCKDAHLEQYVEECPKHKIKFGPDRYCKKCDYKWPKQNYLSTTSTPNGRFWLDGFRSIDGIVRQYVLTSDKMKGVANNIIGKDRVFAIGISFFTSKEKKPVQQARETQFFSPIYTSVNWETKDGAMLTTKKRTKTIASYDQDIVKGTVSYDTTDSISQNAFKCKTSSAETQVEETYNINDLDCLSVDTPDLIMGNWSRKAFVEKTKSPIRSKQLDVSAGAKISQSVYDDTEKLDYWHADSEGILCVNYCDEKSAIEIIERGEIDIEGHQEGFLKGIPVGN